MPPADNTNITPPEPPKQGFWAKLFGKKPKEPEVPAQLHESQTPPPQLDTPTGSEVEPTPVGGTDVTTPNGTEGAPELSTPVPTVGPDEEPPTLDVPDSMSAEPTGDEGTPPTLPTQPEADGGEQSSDKSSDGTPQSPAQ